MFKVKGRPSVDGVHLEYRATIAGQAIEFRVRQYERHNGFIVITFPFAYRLWTGGIPYPPEIERDWGERDELETYGHDDRTNIAWELWSVKKRS